MWPLGRRLTFLISIIVVFVFTIYFSRPSTLQSWKPRKLTPSNASGQSTEDWGSDAEDWRPSPLKIGVPQIDEDFPSSTGDSSTPNPQLKSSSNIFAFPAITSTKDSVQVSPKYTTVLDPAAPAGFNTFSRLYVFNGTLYAVVPTPEDKKAYPQLSYVLSQPLKMGDRYTKPTEKEMQIITESEAQYLLSPDALESAVVIDGLSVIVYDIEEFLTHYYHWWGEIILGTIRAYSALALIPGLEKPLLEPSRFLLPFIHDHGWRDRAGVDGPLMRAAFPSASIERSDFWSDLGHLNRTFVFERATIVNRIAAHRSPLASLWFKMISGTMNITVPAQFWEPLRKRVIRNVVGAQSEQRKPRVLYISRQGGRPQDNGRRLLDADHLALVSALEGLEKEGLCEVNVVQMEKIPLAEQLKLVSKSTIIIGVHGNGLTHQLWMPYSPRSTVIEVFYPNTYLHDYEILSRNMGHEHYALWNDTLLTYPEGQWFKGVQGDIVENFNGNSILAHTPAIIQVIRERLTGDVSL